MKYFFYSVAFIGAAFIVLAGCESKEQKGERLAKQYCSSCHIFTEPGLLDKKNWEKNVLPQMAFRMGFSDMQIMSSFKEEDLNEIITSLPARPMVTEEEWAAIKNYYLSNAPDSIVPSPHIRKDTLRQFSITPIIHSGVNSWITLVQTDTVKQNVWVGTRSGKLFKFDRKFGAEDSVQLASAPSHLFFPENQPPVLSAMGIMDPNDQPRGALELLDMKAHTATPFIDSLKRPVYFEKADLNKDGLEDYIVCSFGNYTGSLSAFENKGDGTYKKYVLLNQPGARKVVIKDTNQDGLNDIIVLMSQGDEQIALLSNSGHFNFRITGLLRFPPVYGSSFFDIADFNHDGNFDILYTNGDNADYSIILKSYHGVHVFLNDGKNKFTKSWSYPMHGASQAMARDFDGDGDIDIAAIAFFPDFTHSEEGFMYFENKGDGFIPQVTPRAAHARWLVMDVADIDQDGDQDVLLGALNFNNGVPQEVFYDWREKKYSLLILRNQFK